MFYRQMFAAFVAAGVFSGAAPAQVFRAVDFDFGAPTLYQIAVEDGAIEVTTVGTYAGPPLVALEFAPDGRLFGFTQLTDNRFVELNPDTAARTDIGLLGFNVFEGGLAFSPEGTAYASTKGTAFEPALFTIDLETGVGTEVAPLSRQVDLSGLAWREDGLLVGIDTLTSTEDLVTIDPATGAVATLAAVQSPRDGVGSGVAVSGGFGYFVFGDMLFPFATELWRFDLYTGEQELVGSVGELNLTGLAALPAAALPGDLNCDGAVNGFDIDPFALALSAPAVYAAVFPDCERLLADINGDGSVDGFDIDPFVELLAR